MWNVWYNTNVGNVILVWLVPSNMIPLFFAGKPLGSVVTTDTVPSLFPYAAPVDTKVSEGLLKFTENTRGVVMVMGVPAVPPVTSSGIQYLYDADAG